MARSSETKSQDTAHFVAALTLGAYSAILKMLKHLKKKQKIEHDKLVHSFMGVFWDPAMFPLIAPFIGVNDTTNLGMTCKEMKLAVDSSSGDLPRLVSEKQEETQIRFERFRFDNDDDEEVTCRCGVSQVQTFTFCVTDQRRQQQVSVELKLENKLWIEYDNELSVGSQSLGQHGRTRMRVSIFLPETLQQAFHGLFITHPDALSFLKGPDSPYRFMENNVPTWNEGDKDLLRCVMAYTFLCVKRIANWQHDSTVYPSVEYLMRDLPEWLYPYFPEEFDWQTEHNDRNTKLEFSYHSAPTLAKWAELMPPQDGETHDYSLDEVPWYAPEQSEDEYSCNDDSDLEETDE